MGQQNSPFAQQSDAYRQSFTNLYLDDLPFDELCLDLEDSQLDKLLINSLESDREYWNGKPWNIQETDVKNVAFLLGEQLNQKDYLKSDAKYVDNRLLASVRAILAYATGKLAVPSVTPSKSDEIYLKAARNIGAALYQHAMDNKVDIKSRAAVLNLITRKRGYLKLRWDDNAGLQGDIVTEVVNPEDIIIDQTAGFLANPRKIYHRIGCTIEEMCIKFPDKKAEILKAYNIQKGVFSQMSKYVYYFECWFTYNDKETGEPKEGVAWFIPDKHLILDKKPNPHWLYFKTKKKEKQANVLFSAPKPFINFNYLNLGKSFIDETCLVEQAIPQQEMLNRRGRQIWENADYVNGRWVANKNAFSQEDAQKLVNKGSKTVALVDSDDVGKAFANVASAPLPAYVENTLYDARAEIDKLMGTPDQLTGTDPKRKNKTLGQDMMIKQQASALQDDLVRSIADGMGSYYLLLLQMMRVHYTDDYWFQTKGGDGKYEFIMLNGNLIDSNVKVGVEVDSTLPLDKQLIRNTSMALWNAGNAIDYRTLMEDLGLPNPEVRTQRYIKSQTDPIGYLSSLEMDEIDTDAESDIQLLLAGKTPEERDDYKQAYFDYFNKVVASNRFQKMKPADQQKITGFLMVIQHAMMQNLNLQESILPPEQIDPMTGLPIQQVPSQVDPTSGQAPNIPNAINEAPPVQPPVPIAQAPVPPQM